MIDLPTAESELKALEDQVKAFKTSQPFYDGQFTTSIYQSPNVYDLTYVTNKSVSNFDITISNISSGQPNAIFEPYLEFYYMDNTRIEIDKINYSLHYEAHDSNENASLVMNVVSYNIPIGTTIGVKLFYLWSATVTGNLSWSLRP